MNKLLILGEISHDFRTPLNAINGFSQLLIMKGCLDKEGREYAQEILNAGDLLLDMIDEALDYVKSGEDSINVEPLSVDSVLKKAFNMTKVIADKKDVSLIFPRREEECLQGVLVDKTRILKALLNYISNGIKYTPPGGRVSVSLSVTRPDLVRITVSDNGFGIKNDQKIYIFKEFYRFHKDNCEIEGTGIGLYITKKLIESMGGEVGFFSEFGVGSKFWMEIPLCDLVSENNKNDHGYEIIN